jgi:hypothetical protein
VLKRQSYLLQYSSQVRSLMGRGTESCASSLRTLMRDGVTPLSTHGNADLSQTTKGRLRFGGL